MNSKIRKFQQSLLNMVNAEELPIEVKRLVITEILKAVENLADEEIRQELIKEKEEKANGESV